jgi:DNA-binding response OmpR family regulator
MEYAAMDKPMIYVIEDHDVIRDGVRQYLELSGFDCMTFANLKEADIGFSDRLPDLLLQDVMLPDGDGFEYVKELRKKYDFPVIFMTARVEESDRILGFEIGADDYITKPFSPKELVLRVKAVLRRYQKAKLGYSGDEVDMTFEFNGNTLKIERDAHQCSVGGELLSLTAAEWRVLLCLVDNAHLLVSRGKILEECFDYSAESYERIVDTHIKNIRAKLGDGGWIETVRGYGYRFVGICQDDDA